VKIKPTIKRTQSIVRYEDLEVGDAFLWQEAIWIKAADGAELDQLAVNLSTGEWEDAFCGTRVVPVDAILHWTKIKPKEGEKGK
jgi:hypothetical protein